MLVVRCVTSNTSNNKLVVTRHPKRSTNKSQEDMPRDCADPDVDQSSTTLTQVGVQILPPGVVVEGPVQVGVATDDAHNVRLLVGGESLRPGRHRDFDGTVGGGGAGGLGRVGAVFSQGDRGSRTV